MRDADTAVPLPRCGWIGRPALCPVPHVSRQNPLSACIRVHPRSGLTPAEACARVAPRGWMVCSGGRRSHEHRRNSLRECLQRVVHGTVDRRALLRWMIGLGLSAPCIAHLLVASTPAQAQTKQPVADFVPTRRGGGGKLRLLWWQAPTILNPHLSSGTKDSDASRVVYEPLAAVDLDANFVPILAVEIPSLNNGGLAKDGTSVTWRLKPGVTWHDGTPFTADDVVFTWEFAADPATGATTTGTYENIERIDKLDDHTVKVVFKVPTAYGYDAFCSRVGLILPKHLFASYKGQDCG